MKLYRSKVPQIAADCIEALVRDGDIEVPPESREEAQRDFIAIMEDYLRRENELNEELRDYMARAGIPYDQRGKTRQRLAEMRNQPLGDDVERYLARQFVENLMISPNVEEVFEEDRVIYKKLLDILRLHDVDEEEIREEAKQRIKNVAEGTVDYEIAMRNAIREVKKRRGLI